MYGWVSSMSKGRYLPYNLKLLSLVLGNRAVLYFVSLPCKAHRFHLRLGYDALTACFLQYCTSSFFHTAGAPFKAPASFNFSLKFSECRRRAVKKKRIAK
jgi:hypothetical protein